MTDLDHLRHEARNHLNVIVNACVLLELRPDDAGRYTAMIADAARELDAALERTREVQP